MNQQTHFKQCPNCLHIWQTLDGFFADPVLEVNGYKADFEKLEYGLFFFTHRADHCHSTFAIEVKEFMPLYQGTRYADRKTGSDGCPQYCLEIERLDHCEQFCECAFAREIMQMFNHKT